MRHLMLIALGILLGAIFVEFVLFLGVKKYDSDWKDLGIVIIAIAAIIFLLSKLKGTQHR